MGQQVGREGEPPFGEVGGRALADRGGETSGEGGARDPGGRGQLGRRPGPGRVGVQSGQRGADDVVTERAIPGRRCGFGPVEPFAQRAHQQPVQHPVEHDLPARPRQRQLRLQIVPQRPAVLGIGDHREPRQHPQQPLRDLGPDVVGADHQHGRLRLGQAGSGRVGEGERIGPAHDRRLTRRDPARLAITGVEHPAAAHRCAQGQRRRLTQQQRPRRREL